MPKDVNDSSWFGTTTTTEIVKTTTVRMTLTAEQLRKLLVRAKAIHESAVVSVKVRSGYEEVEIDSHTPIEIVATTVERQDETT